MGRRWNSYKFQFVCFAVLILGLRVRGSSPLNLEGTSVLSIRARIDSNIYNSRTSWDREDDEECSSLGVNCLDNEVITLEKHSAESRLEHGGDQIGNLESTYMPNTIQNNEISDRASVLRRRLATQSSNLEAVQPQANRSPAPLSSEPFSISSGSFPATTKAKNPSKTDQIRRPNQPTSNGLSNKEKASEKVWVYIAVGIGVVILLAVVVALVFVWTSRCAKPIGPFKTGISGQLQKAFVTGVPKLNRPELETACEEFSNIVATFDAFILYKGTLSSGVEIAVASTRVTSARDWSELAELAYRKKIETLSRVNHKNYVNLLGYCEEDEPFTRMMVFEYAPSGSLFEHLHVKELEHIDWSARMRVIMGAAYCLQYMHHDLNPPVIHPKLSSSAIYLTDDYAAKIVERPFDVIPKPVSSEEGSQKPVSKTRLDPTENIYDFGLLLLEVITGKFPYSEEYGSLVDWAMPQLEKEENIEDLIDPILKSIKMKELVVLCKVIRDCVKPNPWHRPTMNEVVCRLKDAIPVTTEAAVPRLSPLWWAELEILSTEAT